MHIAGPSAAYKNIFEKLQRGIFIGHVKVYNKGKIIRGNTIQLCSGTFEMKRRDGGAQSWKK